VIVSEIDISHAARPEATADPVPAVNDLAGIQGAHNPSASNVFII
jgi:hypothetical protein